VNDIAQSKLAELVNRYGQTLTDDPRRTEALLRDYCGEHRREISVLVGAQRERVPADLLASSGGAPTQIVITRLAKRLEDNLGLAEEAARWAVASWAIALGVVSAKEVGKAKGAGKAKRSSSGTGVQKTTEAAEPPVAKKPASASTRQPKPKTAVKAAAPDVFREVVTLAGTGKKGFADGPGNAAQFHKPIAIACAADGSLYVSDHANRRVRVISPSGEVKTLVGTGERDVSRDGDAATAAFMTPGALAVAPDGAIYVADDPRMGVRVIRPPMQKVTAPGTAGRRGNVTWWTNLKVTSLNTPAFQLGAFGGLALAPDGAIWVSDYHKNRVVRLEPGRPPLVIGTGRSSYQDGPADKAAFLSPAGLAVNEIGNVYVADSGNNVVRKITPDGKVVTVAGEQWLGVLGPKHRDGPGKVARFRGPFGLAIDARGRIYVADAYNYRIRRIELDNSVTTIAGSGARGLQDGPPLTASFELPLDLDIGDDGTIYVVDRDNHVIRAIRP
jgi:serine/threonine protein kinase, bacterial